MDGGRDEYILMIRREAVFPQQPAEENYYRVNLALVVIVSAAVGAFPSACLEDLALTL